MDINGWQFLAWLGCGTLALAALAIVAAVVLRLARVSSPAAHRACWICVLGAGWLMFRLPVEVAYHAPANRAQTTIAPAPLPPSPLPQNPLPQSPLTSATHTNVELAPSAAPDDLAAAPSSTVASNGEIIELADSPTGDALESLPLVVSTRQEIASATAVATAPIIEIAPSEPPTTTTTKPATAFRPTWTEVARVLWNTPEMLVAMWLAGMAFIALVWLVGYARFVRRLAAHEPVEPQWQQQWQSLALQAGVRRRIPMLVTRELGPLLCRLPRGYALIVPAELWEELDEASRGAILRHELAHYLRHDVWKSLAARVLALPHWFNPLAWLAVRRFDEAAEWACDLAASGKGPATDYASTLLRLGQSVNAHAAYAPGAHGRTLAGRIRRLVSGPRHDSRAKRAFLLCVMGALLLATVVRVRLVAQQTPAADDTASKTETATPESAPTIELSDNEAAPVDDKPSAEPADEKPSAAAARKEAASAAAVDPYLAEERKAAQRMLLAARLAYEAKVKAFEEGRSPFDAVVEWSTRWMQAAEEAATEPDAKIAAAGEHLARMESWRNRVKKLFDVGAAGGEPEKLAPMEFHVAEAKARLARLEAEQQRRVEDAAQSDARRKVGVMIERQQRLAAEEAHNAKLRYAGLSFKEWREKLNADLSPMDQREAIRAMGAFGANGLGAEATRKLVWKARTYDVFGGRRSAAAEMANEMFSEAVSACQMIPAEHSAPVLRAVLKSEHLGERLFAVFALQDRDSIPALLAAREDANPLVRGFAVATAAKIDRAAPGVGEAILEILNDVNPSAVVAFLDHLPAFEQRFTPEQESLIGKRLAQAITTSSRSELIDRALPVTEYFVAQSPELQAALETLTQSNDRVIQSMAVSSLEKARREARQPPDPAAQPPVKPSEQPEVASAPVGAVAPNADAVPDGEAAPRLTGSNNIEADPFAEPKPEAEAAKKDEPPFELKVMPIEFRQNDNALIEIQVFNPTSQPLRGMRLVVELQQGVKAKQATEGYKRSGNTLSWKFDQTAIPAYGIISIRLNCGIQATPETLGRVTATNEAGQSCEAPLDFTVLDPDDPEPLSLKVRTLPPPAPVQQPTLAPSEQPAAQPAPKTEPAKPGSDGATVAPPEGFPSSKKLRYEGQTFDEWKEKLHFELNPVRRTEAIQAMEMFGRHGLGRKATAGIVAAMRDTDTWVIDNSPEGMMKHAAIDAISKIPAAESTPVLVEALASDNEFERALAARMMPDKSQLDLLLKATKDESPMVRAAALTSAARLDHDSPEVLEALRKGLDDPAARVALAAASSLIGDRPGALSDEEAQRVTATLARLLDDHDLGIRMQGDIFRLLQELGGRAAGAIPALQKLAAEKNPEIDFLQAAAQEALAKIHREASAAKPEK